MMAWRGMFFSLSREHNVAERERERAFSVMRVFFGGRK